MSEQAELSPEPKKPWFAIIAVSVFAVLAVVGITFRVLSSGEEPQTEAATVSTLTTAPASTTSTGATPVEPTPSETWTGYAGDLSDLLLGIPAGAEAAQIEVTSAGQTTKITDDMPDIVRSVTLWSPSRAEVIRANYRSDGYLHGAMRAWEDQSGNLVIVDLIQFDRATGSATFMGWAVHWLYSGDYVQRDSISEVEGSRWAEFVLSDHHEVLLVAGKGEFGFVLSVNTPESANLDLVKALAIEQFQRLP